MNLISSIKLYLIMVPVFFAVDIVWLALIAKNFYQKHLGYLMAPSVNWPPAVIFYLLYIAGILFFAVIPAFEKQSLLRAVGAGAFLGLVAYATYDLTNYATIRDWPFIVVAVDLAWGMVCSAIVSAAGYLAAVRLFS